ncbi:PREDICTED: uncharacterized protein LOC109580517 [Amphimedon queenslandica]|uniref:Uncharacterized protein n=1 Tax=Amphimedon queenslandica TaxID=400682 RepID=A0AAN0IY37_AMPQE|nr:PREDICTED: uncharacterized protein LOC109580517 [Amphimedon queenslandica]|eukprot:XP_019849353.1 PREDICTED: uncharacterized protein LOC109580517 [Amphimedon queenslandica]
MHQSERLQRLQIDGGRTMFLTSKTRVAPLSQVTVPRLELLGTLLLAKLMKSNSEALKNDLKLLPAICYTDSQVALCWIVGDNKEWKPFVENRVKEIRRLVPVEQWYCPGKDNPADLSKRGVTTTELISDPLWFYGHSQLKDIDSLEYFSRVLSGGNEYESETVSYLFTCHVANL